MGSLARGPRLSCRAVRWSPHETTLQECTHSCSFFTASKPGKAPRSHREGTIWLDILGRQRVHRLAFMRHGEGRRGEADPALTSSGRSMAREASLWLEAEGFSPVRIVATSTQRTLDTQEEASLVFPAAALHRHPSAPEHPDSLQDLLDSFGEGPTLLVGHHPTLAFLLQAFGPSPLPVSHHHFSATLLLEAEPPAPWRIRSAWPGRTGS